MIHKGNTHTYQHYNQTKRGKRRRRKWNENENETKRTFNPRNNVLSRPHRSANSVKAVCVSMTIYQFR